MLSNQFFLAGGQSVNAVNFPSPIGEGLHIRVGNLDSIAKISRFGTFENGVD